MSAVQSFRRVEVTPGSFNSLCDLVGFSDKTAKIVKETLGLGFYYGAQTGHPEAAMKCAQGAQVLGTMRMGFKALDPVTDFATFVRNCQEGNGWDATLSMGSLVSDSYALANDIRHLAGFEFDKGTEHVLRDVGSYLTVVTLTPYTITEACKAAWDADTSRAKNNEAQNYTKQGKFLLAEWAKYDAEVAESKSITRVMNVMEKTMTIALVVFAIVAASIALATTIVVPVVAALAITSAIFGIVKLCRSQFIKFDAPSVSRAEAKRIDNSPQSVRTAYYAMLEAQRTDDKEARRKNLEIARASYESVGSEAVDAWMRSSAAA